MYNLFTIAMASLQIFQNIKRKQVPYVRACISYKRHVTLKITDNAIKQDILETFMYWHFSAFDFKGEMCLYLGLLMQFTKVYSFFAKKVESEFFMKKNLSLNSWWYNFLLAYIHISLIAFISMSCLVRYMSLNTKHL